MKTDTNKLFLLCTFIVSMLSIIMYGAVQSSIRSAANDVPVSFMEDVAQDLESDSPNELLASSKEINIEKSLLPFVVVYNADGTPIAGTGRWRGELPNIPPGIFAYTQANEEDRITWQPQEGIRIALVVKYVSTLDGYEYVAAGRSLREVEYREQTLMMQIAFGWAVTLLIMWSTLYLYGIHKHTTKK